MILEEKSVPGSAGPVVLIVEDELVTRFDIGDAMAEKGYAPFEAATVAEALQSLRFGSVDVALLDVELKGENVLPVVEVLKGYGIPYAFFTGMAPDQLETLGIRGQVFEKPLPAESLATCFHDWVSELMVSAEKRA